MTLLQSTQVYDLVVVGSGGYLCMHIFCALIVAWLNDSLRSRDGIG